mmetsp:Transcript_7063/g.8118  ORF Transcript_7063/g.8118 Transcript_7063/m.8118 type:complete len:496 (-) Transcript_7063:221-1708(-)
MFGGIGGAAHATPESQHHQTPEDAEQAAEIHKMIMRVLPNADIKSIRYGINGQTKDNWRSTVNTLLNEPNSSISAKMIAISLTLLILGSVGVLILGTCDGFREEDMDWFPVEATFTILFTVELVTRCAVQYNDVKSVVLDTYFYIDTLAVIPFYVEAFFGVELPDIIKAVRIVRLFKLARQFQGTITLAAAVQDSLAALTVPGFFLMISATTFGVLVYYIEKAGMSIESWNGEARFRSIPEAIWFIFVTMTTVGYGDMVPTSSLCRVVNVFAMLFGVLFLSMPLAILGNNFCNVWQDRDRVTLIARIREALMEGGANKSTVRTAFEKIDLDKSGSINFKEFVVAIQVLRIDMNVKSLQRLWKSIDTDNSGEIMVDEFAELVFPDVDMGDEWNIAYNGVPPNHGSNSVATLTTTDSLKEPDSAPPKPRPAGEKSVQMYSSSTGVGMTITPESKELYMPLFEELNKKLEQQSQEISEIKSKLVAICDLVGGAGNPRM